MSGERAFGRCQTFDRDLKLACCRLACTSHLSGICGPLYLLVARCFVVVATAQGLHGRAGILRLCLQPFASILCTTSGYTCLECHSVMDCLILFDSKVRNTLDILSAFFPAVAYTGQHSEQSFVCLSSPWRCFKLFRHLPFSALESHIQTFRTQTLGCFSQRWSFPK